MEKKPNKFLYPVDPERIDAHQMLDKFLDYAERSKFIEGRESAIKELMPHTTQFKTMEKMMRRKTKNNPQPN